MITLVRGRPWASCQARISSRPVSSPAAPAGRLQGGRRHAGDLAQGVVQVTSSSSQPWVSERRRRRVDTGRARAVRPTVVAELGVVLHRARTERVGAEVDRVLAVRQPGEVGDQVTLGHLGQRAPGSSAQVPGRDQLVGRPLRARRWCGTDQAAPPGLGQLEDRRLVRPGPSGGRWWPAPGGPGRRSTWSTGHQRTAFSRAVGVARRSRHGCAAR